MEEKALKREDRIHKEELRCNTRLTNHLMNWSMKIQIYKEVHLATEKVMDSDIRNINRDKVIMADQVEMQAETEVMTMIMTIEEVETIDVEAILIEIVITEETDGEAMVEDMVVPMTEGMSVKLGQ